jgi:hypothetical protein
VDKTPVHLKGTSVFDTMEKGKLGRLPSANAKPCVNDPFETWSRTAKKVSFFVGCLFFIFLYFVNTGMFSD